MIASINGTIQKRSESFLILNVHGLGIKVMVPKTVLENVGGLGREIFLHTHLVVREDQWTLFGFGNEEELQLFEVLLGVSGVGPKVALAILSTLSPELLKNAILREEAAVLQRVPGIGKKTAERIMFQLRDKLDFAPGAAAQVPLVTDVDAEVIDFLTGLGYSIVEAQGALQKVPREATTVEERLQAALQYMGQ